MKTKLKIASFIYILCLSSLQSAPAQTTNGLVAYYPFNGNAKDSVGTTPGINGTVNDVSFTTGIKGLPNTACHFSGTSWIDVVDNPVFEFTGDYSISVWLKYTSPQNNGWNYSMVLCKGGYGSPGFQYFIDCNSSGADSASVLYRTPGSNNQLTINTNDLIKIDDGNWHNHFLIRKQDSLYLYIDGALISSKLGGASGTLASTYPLRFGANQDVTSNQNYQGDMDEVRFYNRALSDSEISGVVGTIPLYYRTHQSGNWNDTNTWEASPAANFSIGVKTPVTNTPDFTNAYSVLIRNSHIVTVTKDVSVSKTTLNTSGKLQVNTGIKFTLVH